VNTKLLWQIVGTLLVVGILAGGWFLVVQPVLQSVTADRDELLAVEAQHELITADIRAMTELDVRQLEREVAARTAQLPSTLDEAAIYREIQPIVDGTGALLTRVAITPPAEFVGVPSAAVLPEELAPASTPEALTAAAEAGLVVAPVSIEFTSESVVQALEVLSRLAAADRIYLVSSGTLSESATQRIVAEIYFLPRDPADVAILEGG